ncbi:MAG: bifunctional DNA-formamidopyrimidine glycosylase/DNA-(apurinic or apyrimidinic site) lyase [Burkholderiaceae bacterium]|nr:bifunctional DNA-formamidopyrimidine glycosylase/DNA-(apurinic or apyrimidinic site) lyase [Burkholderiaceae bacterium]
MPELPEVEVTAQALRPAIDGARLKGFRFSGKSLRHPFPKAALARLQGASVVAVGRRAKYVLIEFPIGWLAIHLGMSGSIDCRIGVETIAWGPHDHVGLSFEGTKGGSVMLVYHDPRRFGSFQWIEKAGLGAADIADRLGPGACGMEPLDPAFTGRWLFDASRGRKVAIKQWLMDGRTVVGVGNIYACEALFDAGIHPRRAARAVSLKRYEQLAPAIQRILNQAIAQGGSTIQDFHGPDGQAGRYGQSHRVYGREGQPCPRCARPIRRIVQGQRSTFFCHGCQR